MLASFVLVLASIFSSNVYLSLAAQPTTQGCSCHGRYHDANVIQRNIDKATEEGFWAGDYPHPHGNQVKIRWDNCPGKGDSEWDLWEYPFPSKNSASDVYLGGGHSRDFIIFSDEKNFCGCVTTEGTPKNVNFTRCDLD